MNPGGEKSVKRESLWLLVSIALTKLFEFGVNIVLARILFPEDFGIFGIVAMIQGLLLVLGGWGADAFVIYRQEGEGKDVLNAAFAINLIGGLLLTLLALASAPLTAALFENSRIVPLQRIAAFAFLAQQLGLVHLALLQKSLRFATLAKINGLSLISGFALSIWLALSGYGVYSLVLPILSNAILMTLGYWLAVRWKPGLPFRRQSAREVLSYGRNIFGANFNAFLLQNIDFMIVAKLIGLQALGYYKLAFTLSMALVAVLGDLIVKVLLPTFSRANRDPRELRNLFRSSLEYIGGAALPLFAGLILVGHLIIPLFYGAKWQEAVVPFQLFCLLGLVTVLFKPANSMLKAVGQPQRIYRLSLVFLPITLLLIVAGIPWGLVGVTAGYCAATIAFLVVLFRQAAREINMPVWSSLKPLGKFVLPVLLMMVALFAMRYFYPLPGGSQLSALVVFVLMGAGIYLVSHFSLFYRESAAFYQKLLSGLRSR